MEEISILNFLLVFLCLMTRDRACKGETKSGNFLRVDREALLDFKNGLHGSNNLISSWKGENCCQWEGISCKNNTGAVISIDLHNPYLPKTAYEKWSFMSLKGEIRPSLTKLKFLRYLDLSGNSFEGTPIPKFFGSLKNLHYLNLSNCGFNGAIPPNLGNLSNLQYLDLSFDESYNLFTNDVEWMTSLVSLKYLRMKHVNLAKVGSQWVEALNNLPLLMELHLIDCHLYGPISSTLSLINFTSLSVVSISGHSFHSKFPIWLLNLSSLTFLNLRNNHLYGQIPLGLGELPNLQYLDLSRNNHLTGSFSQLLNGSWKKIQVLNLACKKFLGIIPSSIRNFFSLRYLDVANNTLTGSLPEFHYEIKNCTSEFGLLPNLKYLDLCNNRLAGGLPEWLSQLEGLIHLDLFNNALHGPIPASFGTFRNLKYMELGWNELNGSLPVSFGQLSELAFLDVSGNHLTGILSQQHFSKLSKLKMLWIDGNSGLVLNVSSTWIPPFQITHLDMNSCDIGHFPTWLKSQKEVSFLGLSNSRISGFIPNWFWNNFPQLREAYLCYNKLQGQLPNPLNMGLGVIIDLSFNLLEGLIPPLSGFFSLDLSNNKFSGFIPSDISETMPHLFLLDLSVNQLTGIIPVSVGYMQSLEFLDLSVNGLTGRIPSTISNCSHLSFLSLEMNNLSGTIPKYFGQLQQLRALHLNNNKLSGDLPSLFRNLSMLEILDLSYNGLSGHIPSWIGVAFTSLRILKLRSNAFSGGLPLELSNLSSLHILDLAENNFSGRIPSNLGDLKAMSQKPDISHFLYRISYSGRSYEDILVLNAKGQVLEYIKALSLIISMDLSSNKFSGEFPKELTKLYGLMILNLSRNHINGSIPENISRLHQLQSLDLSSNNLCGIIPSSMSSLSFLSYLNVSNNNFSGEIPFTGQITTFSGSTFTGNPYLCGPPLVAQCEGEDLDQGQGQSMAEDGLIDQWFYFSIGLGFAVGILGPYFLLLVKESWYDTYFNFVDKIIDKLLCLRRNGNYW